MPSMTKLPLLAAAAGLLSLSQLALAKTDLSGCVSTETIVDKYYASYIFYEPDTGEICSYLDCGGGAGAPRYDQPGCPLYTGTGTVTPSYLPGWGASTSTASAAGSATTSSVASTAKASHGSETPSSLLGSASPTITKAPSSTLTTAPYQTAVNGTTSSTSASGAVGVPATSPAGSAVNGASVSGAAAQVLMVAAGAAAAVAMAVL